LRIGPISLNFTPFGAQAGRGFLSGRSAAYRARLIRRAASGAGRVNSPKNDDAALLERVAYDDAERTSGSRIERANEGAPNESRRTQNREGKPAPGQPVQPCQPIISTRVPPRRGSWRSPCSGGAPALDRGCDERRGPIEPVSPESRDAPHLRLCARARSRVPDRVVDATALTRGSPGRQRSP